MQNITINTIIWVNGRTRLNQTNMNNIERNLNTIVAKVNELVDYANSHSVAGVVDVRVGGASVVTGGIAQVPAIPTKVSDLANDAGYLHNPMSAAGDMIVGANYGSSARLPVGSSGSVLCVGDNGTPAWGGLKTVNGGSLLGSGSVSVGDVNPLGYLNSFPVSDNQSGIKIVVSNTEPPQRKEGYLYIVTSGSPGGGYMTNPMTAPGDIIYGATGGSPTKLAKGSEGQVLTIVSGSPAWQTPGGGGGGGGMSNPMNALGDIIYGGDASGTPTKLAKGNDGQVLMLSSNVPTWQNATPITSPGDLIIGNALHGNPTRLAVGANGEVLSSNGLIPVWKTPFKWHTIYSGSNVTSYDWSVLSQYSFLVFTGYRYGGPENYNICQVMLSTATLSAIATYHIETVPLSMNQGSNTYYNAGVGFSLMQGGSGSATVLSWSTGEYSGQTDFGVFRIEGLK